MNPSLAALIPFALAAFALWAMKKWGHAPGWTLIVALLLGVALSGTLIGQDIQNFLSQLSGGRIH